MASVTAAAAITDFTSGPYETVVYPNFPNLRDNLFQNKRIQIMDSSVYSYIQLTLTADIENYQDMCMGLRKKYITDSIMDDDINLILVVYKKTAATSRVIGLALVQLYDAKFEIDVLCGSTEIKGLGTYLIQLVKEIGLRYDKTELTLSSVTEALGFYTKQGFECDSLCPMKLEIADALKGGKRKFTRRRKYTKRKRSKSKKRT